MQNQRSRRTGGRSGLRGAAIAAAVIAAFAVGAYAQMPAPQEPGVLTVRSGEWTGDTETLIPGELLQTRIKRVSTPPEYYFSYSAGLTYNTISAITASGGLFRWGDHQGAALGDGSTFGSTAPVQADTGQRIVDVVDEFFYTLALTDGGEVLAWGSAGGAIGDATPGEERFTPEPLPVEGTAMAGAYITQIAGGLDGALALADDGTVFGWGTGSSDVFDRAPAVVETLPGDARIVQVAAGEKDYLALAGDGRIFHWGTGHLGTSEEPELLDPAGTALDGAHITQLASSENSVLALSETGDVYGWGENRYGQLGNSTDLTSDAPVAVTTAGTPMDGAKITRISVSGRHALALANDGRVFAWGSNASGELGDGTEEDSNVPVQVPAGDLPAAGISYIHAGAHRSLAIAEEGEVFQWGRTWLPRLGAGPQEQHSAPVPLDLSLEKEVAQVLFGEEEARDFSRTATGDLQVLTPRQEPSTTTVDVTVVFTDSTELVLDDAFTYTWEEREHRDSR